MDLKTEIIKIVKENSYKVEYKDTNGYEMAEIELSDVADEIVKLTIPLVSKRLNLVEIDNLLDLAYMNVEGDGFSDENDIIKYKNEWREKIGYSKQDL